MMRIVILLACSFNLLTMNAQTREISSYLYGQNFWLDNGDENRQGYLHLLWPKIAESGVKIIRIGGNYYNHQFPGNSRLLGMVDSVKKIGAQPFVQVPYFFTTEQTADLVYFLNTTNKRNVRYWSIGNEPSLEKEKIKIEEAYIYLKTIATAIKSIDPALKIFVYDECYLYDDYARICGGDLDMAGKTDKGAWLIDGISFHCYPNGEMTHREQAIVTGPASIRSQVVKLMSILETANKKHNRTGAAKLLWALTETNVTYLNPDREISGFGNPSFLGGQYMAEMYGIGMEFGAFSIHQWCLNETDQVSTDFGFIGLPAEFRFRSSFYHMQMMSRFMKGGFIKSFSDYSYVKSFVTGSEDEICVMLLNEDNIHDLEFELQFNKTDFSSKPVLIYVPLNLDKKYDGIIPNQSTVILIFDTKGELQKQVSYSLKNNLENQPPEIR